MLPDDPIILLSFVNTKLRDDFECIEELCLYYDIEKNIIDEKLNFIDYHYNKELNQYK